MDLPDLVRIAENDNWRTTNEWKRRYEEAKNQDSPILQPHRDVEDDTVDLISYWYTITSPKFYLPVFFALRATLLVGLPLIYLSDKYSHYFIASTLLGLWGMINCKDTVGEQIMMAAMSLQTSLWGLLWGTLVFYWGALHHTSAWWCTLFFVSFVIALWGDLRSKRLLIMISVVMMEMGRINISNDPKFSLKVGRDLLMATGFAVVQAFIPPFQMTTQADATIRAAWKDVGNIVRSAAAACWSHDPVEVLVSLSRVSTEPLHRAFATVPAQLFFVMYEPWESTLRLQLRKERMEIIRHVLPHLSAMSAAARSLHTHQRAQQLQNQLINVDELANSFDAKTNYTDHSLPRVEKSQVLFEYLHAPLQTYLEALDATFDALGKYLNPRETAENVPFGQLQEATSELQSAIDRLHFDTTVKGATEIDSVEYMNIVFAHLMMVLLGEEILKYGELMRNFDRKRYKSGWRRFVEFFFLDYWNSFWSELPNRLTLATPRDVRMVKDAIKLALAYTVGVMYTLYIDRQNPYYFGMSILTAVGLPTAGESLVSGVQRVAGVAFATAIAYVARVHSNNQEQKYAILLCGVFVSCYARNFLQYFHVATYTMLIIMSVAHLLDTPLSVLSRVASNSFTVMTYYAIVVFVFPIDTIKTLHNMEVKAVKSLSDTFSELMSLVLAPVDLDDEALRKRLGEMQGRFVGLWASLQTVVLWIPLAAAEPTIRGMPYPAAAQTDYMPVLRRLASSLDIVRIALLGIHRKRTDSPDGDTKEVLLSVGPLLRTIDRYCCYIMQDFVTALQDPMHWSYADAANNFSILTRLNLDLRDAFAVAMRSIFMSIRKNFQQRVLRRTFAMHYSGAEPFAPPSDRVTPKSPEQSIDSLARSMGLFEDNRELHLSLLSVEEKEREELTAPRNASFMLRPEEFTINHDVNMSIAVLVGYDMFCHELDKTLQIMFRLNQFERSRRA